nr:hypothetical protein BaRGS_009894 [Batillaria attramentaria]
MDPATSYNVFCSVSAAGRSGQSQTSTTVRRRSGKKRQPHDQDQNQHAALDSPDSVFADEEQCEICFENTSAKVQLYPCKHSDICVKCVSKLLVTCKRECPFCRRRIDGYMDIESRQMFG